MTDVPVLLSSMGTSTRVGFSVFSSLLSVSLSGVTLGDLSPRVCLEGDALL